MKLITDYKDIKHGDAVEFYVDGDTLCYAAKIDKPGVKRVWGKAIARDGNSVLVALPPGIKSSKKLETLQRHYRVSDEHAKTYGNAQVHFIYDNAILTALDHTAFVPGDRLKVEGSDDELVVTEIKSNNHLYGRGLSTFAENLYYLKTFTPLPPEEKKPEPAAVPPVPVDELSKIKPGDYVTVWADENGLIDFQYADRRRFSYEVHVKVLCVNDKGILILPGFNLEGRVLKGNPASGYDWKFSKSSERLQELGLLPGSTDCWEIYDKRCYAFYADAQYASALQKEVMKRPAARSSVGVVDHTKEDSMAAVKKSLKDKLKKNVEDGMYLAAAGKGVEAFRDGLISVAEKRGGPEHAMIARMVLANPAAMPVLSLLFGIGLDYVPKYGEDERVARIADSLRTKGIEGGANIAIDVLKDIIGPAAQTMIDQLPAVASSATSKKKVRIGDKRVAARKTPIAAVPDVEEDEEAEVSRAQRKTA